MRLLNTAASAQETLRHWRRGPAGAIRGRDEQWPSVAEIVPSSFHVGRPAVSIVLKQVGLLVRVSPSPQPFVHSLLTSLLAWPRATESVPQVRPSQRYGPRSLLVAPVSRALRSHLFPKHPALPRPYSYATTLIVVQPDYGSETFVRSEKLQ
jgi:hypothetical protein